MKLNCFSFNLSDVILPGLKPKSEFAGVSLYGKEETNIGMIITTKEYQIYNVQLLGGNLFQVYFIY